MFNPLVDPSLRLKGLVFEISIHNSILEATCRFQFIIVFLKQRARVEYSHNQCNLEWYASLALAVIRSYVMARGIKGPQDIPVHTDHMINESYIL